MRPALACSTVVEIAISPIAGRHPLAVGLPAERRKRGAAIRATAFAAPANHLLAALPRTAYRGMLARLERVAFELGATLYEAGTSPRHVYFPNDSMVSLIGMTLERNRLELGLVGREGMVGCSLALGAALSPTGALVQGSGSAMRMGAADFGRELERNPTLHREVLRCASAQMATAMQIAACNNAHLL